MTDRHINMSRSEWQENRKRLDPFIKILLASYALTFLKGGRGANINELSFVTELKCSRISALLKAVRTNNLALVLEVRQDKTAGLVKSGWHNCVPRVLPKNQLDRGLLRNMSRSRGPLGKLYLISLRDPERREPVLKELETATLTHLLVSTMPSIIEYLKRCKTTEYKFAKSIAKFAIRDARIVVQRTANLYDDIKFMDNRVSVLRYIEKVLGSVEIGMNKIRRRRELINELELWHEKLIVVIPTQRN